MNKAYVYCRVSTELQVEAGISLEVQVAKAKAWANLNDYVIPENGVFTEAGISGRKLDNRPELQKALDAVCSVKKSVLIIYSLSRLSRSLLDTMQIADRLEKSDVDLVSLSERIDTTSAFGKMTFRMLSIFSEFEVDQTVERINSAMNYKRSKGERIGKIPFGFTLAADGSTLEKDPVEQEVLGVIQNLRSTGLSLRDIATELNRRNIATKAGNPWIHTSVKSILDRATAEAAFEV